MARLDAIRTAARPKMYGRAMLSGPSGAGKTWTSLGMADVLARFGLEPDAPVPPTLMIDTERESALTYADVFAFDHLPWRPPFDPDELSDTLIKLEDRFGVVIVDSFSKFWRGQGGTLDIADGRIGGWKTARPVQERVTEAVLSVQAHVILCVRSKMEYLIENGGHTVTKMGLAPIQDDTLVYEMNIAADLDMEHRITVTKSRTPAVPVGRMYPAGLERKAAEDYAEWLAGGVPPAAREDVNSIVAAFADIVDADRRKVVKAMFVECFGMPHSLTAAQVTEAREWLVEQLGGDGDGITNEPDEVPTEVVSGTGAVIDDATPPAIDPDELPSAEEVEAMDKDQLVAILEGLGLATGGGERTLKARLLAVVAEAGSQLLP